MLSAANVDAGINDGLSSNRIDTIRCGDDCGISLINKLDNANGNPDGGISEARHDANCDNNKRGMEPYSELAIGK